MTSGYPILESLHLCMANDTCSGYSKKDRPRIGWSHHLDHLHYIPQVLDLSGDAIDKEVEIYIYGNIWIVNDIYETQWIDLSENLPEREKDPKPMLTKSSPKRRLNDLPGPQLSDLRCAIRGRHVVGIDI